MRLVRVAGSGTAKLSYSVFRGLCDVKGVAGEGCVSGRLSLCDAGRTAAHILCEMQRHMKA